MKKFNLLTSFSFAKKIIFASMILLCFSTAVKAQIPTSGLTAYWPFDGNANDSSGNGNNGTNYGATPTKDRFGNSNHAYKFDGISNYILVPNSPTVDFSNSTDFTVAFWMKTYSNDLDGIPLCKQQYGSFSGYLFFTNNTNGGYCNTPKHVSFYTASGSQQDACSDSTVTSDTTWHFITGVYHSATNQSNLFIDGVQQADVGQTSGTISNAYNLVFGAHSNTTNLFFNGALDDIRLYNRALTNAEIALLYNERGYNPKPSSNTSINFCYYLGGPFQDPSPFLMDACSAPNDGNGDPCVPNFTEMKVTCLNGTFPADLSFNISVSGGGCSTPFSTSMTNTIFNNSNFHSFTFSNCFPSSAYNVAITNINNTSPISWNSAETFTFTIEFDAQYDCPDQTFQFPTCSTADLKLTFNYPQITNQFYQLGPFNICQGQTVDLDVHGLENEMDYGYFWTGPGGTSFSTPTGSYTTGVPGIYSVAMSILNSPYANNACDFETASAIVNLLPSPSVSVSPQNTSVCPGTNVTLTASGNANVYTWSNGQTGTSISVSPGSTTTYSVIGTFTGNGCSSPPATATVSINPLPNFSVSANPPGYCVGGTSVISAQGNSEADAFVWSGGGINQSCAISTTPCSVSVSPSVTTIYSVIATNTFGCHSTHTVSVNVTGASAVIGVGPTVSTSTVIPSYYVCEITGGGQNFSSMNTAANYNWSIAPAGGITFVSGNSTQTIALVNNNVSSSVTYTLTLTVTNYLPGGQPCPNTTTILIKPCCSPASTGYSLMQTTWSGGTVPPGNYVVMTELYISGATTISNSNFIMNPGSSIVCADNLTLNNCHFYACSDMWEGFMFDGTNYLNPNPTLTINNSLIEDANYGINVANPPSAILQSNYQAHNPIIKLNNAWFNRCAVGIANEFDPLNANIGTPNNNVAALTINNCVFTCRNGITMSNVSTHNTGILTLLSPPVGNLHNFKNISNYTSFTGIAAGDGDPIVTNTIKNCFFDFQMDGILGASNWDIQKCTFQFSLLNPVSTNPNYTYFQSGNYGISTQYMVGNVPKAGSGINFYGTQLSVGGSAANANLFSFCYYGIIAEPSSLLPLPVNISHNNFKNTFYSGIYLNNTAAISSHVISDNKFNDHLRQAIDAFYVPVSGYNAPLSIFNNTFAIVSTLYTINNPPYAQLPEAISVKGFPSTNNSLIEIASNQINNYQLGITALNAHGSNVHDNTIKMYEDNNSLTANWFTHGIFATNCHTSFIEFNNVNSSNAVNGWKYGQFGIFTENCTNSFVDCNVIDGPDVSLKCQGPNNVSTIHQNTLKDAALFNFWLDNNGFVGPQGNTHSANANKFMSIGQYALIATNGSNGNGSPFYYANSPNYIPLPSNAFSGASVIQTFSLSASYGHPLPCSAFHLMTKKPIMSGGTAGLIASNNLHFSEYDATAVYGNKLNLYRTLNEGGPSSYETDQTLISFMQNLQGSSYEQLVAADTLFQSAGLDPVKINLALNANNSFAPAEKYDNYLQQANNLYGTFLQQKKRLNSTQVQHVRDIAQLCPYEYGEGVYRARALLSCFDTLRYVNSCERMPINISSGNASGEETISRNEGTKLNAFPNPTTGELTVEYSISDQTCQSAVIQITELGTGKVLVKKNVACSSTQTTFDVRDLANGVYVLSIQSNGTTPKHLRIIKTE